MYILTVIGFCFISTALLTLVRQYKPEFAMPLSLLCAAMILIAVVVQAAGVTDTIMSITEKASVSQENIRVLLKGLGICYVTQLAKDCCMDSGESALASKIDLAGRISLAVLSLPLLSQILDYVTHLLQ